MTARSRQRAVQMVVLREQGVSLDEIAGRFEVSRERVRQILRAHGGPTPQNIADARRERAEQLAQAHVDTVAASALDDARAAIARRVGYQASFSHFPIVGVCPTCAQTQPGSRAPCTPDAGGEVSPERRQGT